MERQRSFSVKSTSFIALFLTISSSLVFFTFFSLWVLKTTNSPIDSHSLPAQSPILINTHFSKPENTSGSSISPAAEAVILRNRGFGGEASDEHKRKERESPEIDSHFLAAEAPILIDTRFSKPENASGSSVSPAAKVAIPRNRGSGGDIEKASGEIGASDEHKGKGGSHFLAAEASILVDTHFSKPGNTTGSSISPAAEVIIPRSRGFGSEIEKASDETESLDEEHKEELDRESPDIEIPITAPSLNNTNAPIDSHSLAFLEDKAPILINTHFGKPGNTSGPLRSPAAEDAFLRSRGFGSKIEKKSNDAVEPLDESPEMEKLSGEIEGLNGKMVGENEGIRLRDCDLGKGEWVYEESYPLYTNWSCPFIDEGFNCGGNGRPDNGYMKWRWQPHDCQIPRFNATEMLEMIRGKRLVFVGDSINRNQWESMMCMLMAAVGDPKKVYETHGRRITKEKGNYCFKFVNYKCTVEYYVTHFLVHESKARVGQKRLPTLRIDSIDRGSSRWRGADILVFNTAHWWSHYKTKAGINYYQEGSLVHPKLEVSMAFRKALMTWASWVDKHIDPRKTRVFFRSSAPSHFRGGEWNSGGHCREAKLPLNTTSSTGYDPEKSSIMEEVIRSMRTPVTFLNITGLSNYRIDAHPSAYGGGKSGKGRLKGIEDCSHWCLPGVPDTWNELLYIHLQMTRPNHGRETV